MSGITNKIIATAVIAVFLSSAFLILSDSDELFADTPIIITDSTGTILTLDGPANKVATFGYGFTLSVVELGGKDKIVAYDLASIDVVNEYGVPGENIGSAFTANFDGILASMIQLSDNSVFNKSTDVIIINNYSFTVKTGAIRDKLENEGFKVLCFGADTYEEVVIVIENIAKVIGKESSEVLAKMNKVKTDVYNAGKDIAEEDKVTAMYVDSSKGNLRIFNSGIAASMIELAGGKNIGNNGGTSVNYLAEASTILQLNPDVVFLDGNHPLTVEEFQNSVLKTDSIKVIKLKKDSNNYCPAASDGLLIVSTAILDVYDSNMDSDEGISLSTIATIAVVAIILVVLFGLLIARRH